MSVSFSAPYTKRRAGRRLTDLGTEGGLRSGDGHRFNLDIVGRICKQSGLKSRRERLRDKGMLTLKEMARRLRVKDLTVIRWRREGRIIGYRSNYRTEYLYVAPGLEHVAALTGRSA